MVAAQEYPTKPVRLIIPFPPGGSNDVVGRVFAQQMSENLGKQVVVDNRGAGAGGIVGTEVVANSPKEWPCSVRRSKSCGVFNSASIMVFFWVSMPVRWEISGEPLAVLLQSRKR